MPTIEEPRYERPKPLGGNVTFAKQQSKQEKRAEETLKEKQQKKKQKLIKQLSIEKGSKPEYKNPADELSWLNFETRMRGVIKGLLEPIVEMSNKDREGMVLLQDNFRGHDNRLGDLEEAIFNTVMNEGETILDKQARKIKDNEIFMKTELDKLRAEQQDQF